MTRLTLHLAAEAAWEAHDPATPYTPPRYAEEGFIHCTDGDDEMLRTANRHYRAVPGTFLCLTVDLERTGSPWRIDEPGKPYPHIYGPLDPAAVVAVRRFTRAPDGTFTGLEDR
jgi:uncharacterized protein (DUF952 family)